MFLGLCIPNLSIPVWRILPPFPLSPLRILLLFLQSYQTNFTPSISKDVSSPTIIALYKTKTYLRTSPLFIWPKQQVTDFIPTIFSYCFICPSIHGCVSGDTFLPMKSSKTLHTKRPPFYLTKQPTSLI
jgi:hypothetical protein